MEQHEIELSGKYVKFRVDKDADGRITIEEVKEV